MMDSKAKKILTSTFWSASGWKQGGGYAGLLVAGSDFRKERGRGTDFMSVATWRGEDGYSRERMEYLFGMYLSHKEEGQ